MTPLNAVDSPLAPAPRPAAVNDNTIGLVKAPTNSPARPLHTRTESTLAPTSEFVRYFLLAYPSRYLFRGVLGALFDVHENISSLSQRVWNIFPKVGDKLDFLFSKSVTGQENLKQIREDKFGISYNLALGVGSTALTTSYSWMVYKDIKSVFSEAVAEETGKKPEELVYADFAKSDNRMVQQTMRNFKSRLFTRLFTDMLFIPAAWLRKPEAGDFMLGVKAVQLFADTWKRKTTMFEDFVTFVNNKINPRNGIGQPIAVGEVFDLYQHYAESTRSEKMFQNVLERGTGEGARWARAQPIFLRLTDLMNKTYAYKHSSILGANGHSIQQGDFTLPKFIYLLGHDLIDVDQPEKTMALVEVANRYGIPAVKEMNTMLGRGATLEQAVARYPFPVVPMDAQRAEAEKNGVIAKGSTMQMDAKATPTMKIDAATIRSHEAPSRNSLLPNLV